MKRIFYILFMISLLPSCQGEKEETHVNKTDWVERKTAVTDFDDLIQGRSYLPAYSHIYHRYDNHTFDLTITVSIRNISTNDSVYILKADYYNTQGDKIREYLDHPVYLKPMETVEIIIAESDKEGGSGANFLFDWAVNNPENPPLFEAVMISTYGQQGLSFSTRGVQVHN